MLIFWYIVVWDTCGSYWMPKSYYKRISLLLKNSVNKLIRIISTSLSPLCLVLLSPLKILWNAVFSQVQIYVRDIAKSGKDLCDLHKKFVSKFCNDIWKRCVRIGFYCIQFVIQKGACSNVGVASFKCFFKGMLTKPHWKLRNSVIIPSFYHTISTPP